MECETRWTVDGHELTIPELANRLKELIIMQQKKVDYSREASSAGSAAENITFLGTATRQVGELDKKEKEGEDAI